MVAELLPLDVKNILKIALQGRIFGSVFGLFKNMFHYK